MQVLKQIIWRIVQLVILPLAIYGGLAFNGFDFASIHAGLTDVVYKILSIAVPHSYVVMDLSGYIAFIPALLAYPMPPGFLALLFVFGGLIGGPGLVMMFLGFFLLFIRMPFSSPRAKAVG